MQFGRESALSGLSFAVPSGAIYALVGPNGAGKTTLIKLLLNILRPTSGLATVLGRPSTEIRASALTEIAYVSENQELPDWMTVTQLLRYLRPFYPGWDRSLEQQLTAQMNVPMGRALRHLSRGQRMKAALMSVLPYHPRLIVLDEPFSGLDPLVRDQLTEGLLDRAAEPNPPTILISSHDLSEIETIATHIGFLDGGRLLFSEESATLADRFREVTVTLAPDLPQRLGTEPTNPPYPAAWLLPQRSSSVLRFVHAHADADAVRAEVRAAFPTATAVDLEPMTLRAIFVALAKSTFAQSSHKPHLSADRSRA